MSLAPVLDDPILQTDNDDELEHIVCCYVPAGSLGPVKTLCGAIVEGPIRGYAVDVQPNDCVVCTELAKTWHCPFGIPCSPA